ncbi:TPA_asm: hypothetical protein vir519_00040 [Caudoviricetes sp. vir519]|nr:TPA_asm: hypothetical protein vir519_00040 [Caudoviricetes sp. vir519]
MSAKNGKPEESKPAEIPLGTQAEFLVTEDLKLCTMEGLWVLDQLMERKKQYEEAKMSIPDSVLGQIGAAIIAAVTTTRHPPSRGGKGPWKTFERPVDFLKDAFARDPTKSYKTSSVLTALGIKPKKKENGETDWEGYNNEKIRIEDILDTEAKTGQIIRKIEGGEKWWRWSGGAGEPGTEPGTEPAKGE